MIRVFIGYDPHETRAYHVFAHSIMERASVPVSITPIALTQLEWIYTRERGQYDSTEFAISRFLVPFLCDYQGWAAFFDCDMLMRTDIAKLWALRDDRYAVMCTQHDHQPQEQIKFLGSKQTRYGRKNWSSVMLMNCKRCTKLTPDYIDTAPGLDLHQFKWLRDHEIGSIPLTWNHLVGYQDFDPDAANVHFTIGGPYFHRFKDCDYADEWREADTRALFTDQVGFNTKWLKIEDETQTKVRDDERFISGRLERRAKASQR